MQPSWPACLDGFPNNKGTRPPGVFVIGPADACAPCVACLPSKVLAVVRPPADACVCMLDLCAFELV
jgi:hypothetical protein